MEVGNTIAGRSFAWNPDMTRRAFLAGVGAVGAVGIAEGVSLQTPTKLAVRFGVVTDAHYSTQKTVGDRHYGDSLAKMRQAVDAFNGGNLDFAIELGDLKDMGPKPDRDETLRFLDAIEGAFAQFKGPRYHVLGNHDMDCISKEDFLAHTGNHGAAKGKKHYAFETGGVKFVVLDACYNKDRTPYHCGNFDWTQAYIPDDELDWFDAELKKATTPVVVFCHQMLDGFSATGALGVLVVGNWKQIAGIMESCGSVVAAIQGHHHAGHYSFRNGIHYWTMKGMITGAHPPHNSYAVVEVSPSGSISISGFGDCKSCDLQRGRAIGS